MSKEAQLLGPSEIQKNQATGKNLRPSNGLQKFKYLIHMCMTKLNSVFKIIKIYFNFFKENLILGFYIIDAIFQ